MNYLANLGGGLDILLKYSGTPMAEHGYLYVQINGIISPQDHDALIALGWVNNTPDITVWFYQTGVMVTSPIPVITKTTIQQ
jgi:hypothetical protein